MTLRRYCEQMGLRVVCDIVAAGFRCSIVAFHLADSCGKAEASAEGGTPEKARASLVSFIAGRIIQRADRPTYLCWVPDNLSP